MTRGRGSEEEGDRVRGDLGTVRVPLRKGNRGERRGRMVEACHSGVMVSERKR